MMYKLKRTCLAAIIFTIISGTNVFASPTKPSYPIDSNTVTTVERTIVPIPIPAKCPKLLPTDISQYAKYGYGLWRFGSGMKPEKRLDIMSPTYSDKNVKNQKKLLRFAAITDVHITDKETPAQAIFYGYKGAISSGYSGIMLYTTQVLDATVQTVNALNKKEPVDFGISLGDICNGTQYNELRWYIDVLDGKVINPSSGSHEGASTIDYQKPFKAAGIDKTIPWYQVIGNHDHFWLGFLPANDYIRKTLVGKDILNLGNAFTDPSGADSRGYYMGAIDGSTPYGDLIGVGPTKKFTKTPQVKAADPARRSLHKSEWINEFFKTTSNPIGHGFSKANVEQDFACYSFEPKTNLPLKVIVLDDTQNNDDPTDVDSLGYGHAMLDQKRYEWLVNELDKGQAEGKLMIIATHAPLVVETGKSMMAWSKYSYVPETTLMSKLHEYSNLMMVIAGHRHGNVVTAFKSPDSKHPEFGFWQVETSALRDYPQQFRTFDIMLNSDNNISIFATDVDPNVKIGSLAAKSRSYAIATQQIFNNKVPYLTTGVYNAELFKQLSSEMQDKLQKLHAIAKNKFFLA